jgi:PadR family transcriptional regulator PadR
MGHTFLTLSTTTILEAVANGHAFGFDIVDLTGMPGGTVYPALRRLEEARPRRRYYEVTPAGREALAEAARRYRRPQPAPESRRSTPKPTRA